MTRLVVLTEALDGLVAQRPRLLLVDGRLEGGEDVLQTETLVLVQGALDDSRQTTSSSTCAGAAVAAAGGTGHTARSHRVICCLRFASSSPIHIAGVGSGLTCIVQ